MYNSKEEKVSLKSTESLKKTQAHLRDKSPFLPTEFNIYRIT